MRSSILKQVLQVALIIMISLVGIACGGNGETDNNNPCNCPETAHLDFEETCDCGLANCNCTQKVWGNVVDAERNVNIPIYKKGDVDVEDMETAVENVQAAYTGLDGSTRDQLAGNIAAIVILPTGSQRTIDTKDGDGMVTINFPIGINQSQMGNDFYSAINYIGGNRRITLHHNTQQQTTLHRYFTKQNETAPLQANTYQREGFNFLGWSTTPTGGVEYANEAPFSLGTEDVTLYAVWGEL